MTTDLTGKKFGQYELKDLLGRGGMALVYRAYQSSMKRDVAIKVMTHELGADPEFVQRFEREAELFAILQHPHILPVIDFGQEGDRVYIVMRLVEGGSLDQRIKDEGAMEPAIVARMIHQIGSALHFAHMKGIIHRDLKPNNVLLDENDNAYLTDFGIAKMLAGTSRLTATNTVLGTPAYMAPEQWRGEQIDARSDIYSLGIMTYEMLTGHLPFEADTTFTMMYKHFNDPPPPPRQYKNDLSPSVEAVVLRSLAKEADDRYQSADTFADSLRAAVEGRPIEEERVVVEIPPKPQADDQPTYVGAGHQRSENTTDMQTIPGAGMDGPTLVTPSGDMAGDAIPAAQPDETMIQVEKQRGIPGWLLALGAILLLAAIGAGLFFALGSDDDANELAAVATDTPTATTTPTDTPEPTATSTLTDTPEPTATATSTATSTPTVTETPSIAQAQVITQRSVVYAEPGRNFAEVGVLTRDEEVQVVAVSEDGAWYRVLVGGDLGWVSAETVSISGNESVIAVVALPTATYTPTLTSTPTPTATPTSTPTDTPEPTATDTPDRPPLPTEVAGLPAASPQLPIEVETHRRDDFSGEMAWNINTRDDDRLLMQTIAANGVINLAFPTEPLIARNAYVSANFQVIEAAEDYDLGLVLRGQPDQFYYLAIDQAGVARFYHVAGEDVTVLMPPLTIPDLDMSQPNTLSVFMVGNFMEFYVNETLLGVVDDETITTAGTIMLAARTGEDASQNTTVAWDDFQAVAFGLQRALARPDAGISVGLVEYNLPMRQQIRRQSDVIYTIPPESLIWVLGQASLMNIDGYFVYTNQHFGWVNADQVIVLTGHNNIPPINRNMVVMGTSINFQTWLDNLADAPPTTDEDRFIGTINDQNPTVSYTLTGEAGEQITLTAVTRSGSLDTVLQLFGPDGSLIAENDDHPRDQITLPGSHDSAIVDQTLPVDGTYTIVVSRYNAALGTSSGEFELQIERPVDQPETTGGSQGSADGGELLPDTPIQLTINDDQYAGVYQLTASAGDRVTLTAITRSGSLDPLIELFSPEGDLLATNDDHPPSRIVLPNTRDSAIVDFEIPADGVYTVRVARYNFENGTTSGVAEVGLTVD